MDRRSFVLSLGALAAARSFAQAAPDAHPFALGVASGYPTPRGIVLWTRLIGVAASGNVPVAWEIASDEAMRSVVASGRATASAEWAHSIHVDVSGLEPERWYWYRFTALGARSAIGRTRTAPEAGAAAPRLRFAFASCQQYEHGYYGAYRHMAADSPDLVVFLGDYIYESTWGRELVRSHGAPETFTLEDYRARYALYKSDPDLQAAHAACPWIVTWDDHEVVNDYAGTDPAWRARSAAGYRAFYEHMPLPSSMRPDGAGLPLYCALDWGSLARFCVLDDRQYRSVHACEQPRRRGGGSTVVDVETCAELAAEHRTLLGAEQELWLERTLAASPARWNVLAQQSRMAQWDLKPGPGRSAWTDGWDGYPAARRRLMEFLASSRTRNPVVIGGDIHHFNVAQLKADFDDPASPVVASEFVGTSITSHGPSQQRIAQYLPDNPHVLMVESRYRGYARVDVSPHLWRCDLRAMDNVRERDAACRTLASFVVEDGKPGPVRA